MQQHHGQQAVNHGGCSEELKQANGRIRVWLRDLYQIVRATDALAERLREDGTGSRRGLDRYALGWLLALAQLR